MAQARSQFIGLSGQYYVAYGLAVRHINVSLTVGNAPAADLFVCSGDGLRSLTLQVKTSRNAYRRKRYGREGFEWRVGASTVGNEPRSFWYAFVDLAQTAIGTIMREIRKYSLCPQFGCRGS